MDVTEVVELRGRPKGSVGQIREVHHFVARMLAKGHKPTEIARVINRSPATVRLWMGNPAMAELVAQYAAEAFVEAESELDYRTMLARRNATVAREIIADRLEGDPDAVPIAQLVKIAGDGDDRTGLGRQETRVNMHVDLGSKLDKAREAKAKLDEARKEGRILDFVRRA